MDDGVDREPATYRMLQQVLQNHLTTYTISWEAAICACGTLLSELARQLVAAGVDQQTLVPALVTRLKAALLARHAQPPCLHGLTALDPDLPTALVQEHVHLLGHALQQVLCETGVAHGLMVDAGVQIALHLTADALHGFVHQLEYAPEDTADWFDECFAEGMTHAIHRYIARAP